MKVILKNNIIFECDTSSTIVDGAILSKLFINHSCKTGRCGICKTTLLEGQVIELIPQLALTDEQKKKNQILTCCCSPKTDILIDAEELSFLHGIDSKVLPARISSIKRHTADIIEVWLRLPPTAIFKFIEGQYIDVTRNDIRRSYSIASSSNQKEIILLIKRFNKGSMSDYWFNYAKENDLLRIHGPKGTFFLRDHNKSLIFLATGTGISPVMSILNNLDQNLHFQQQKPISVIWGNRQPEEFVWQPKFQKLNVDFTKVCSTQIPYWSGELGYVHKIAISKHTCLADCVVYACGSNAMIQSSKQLFSEAGLPDSQFYSDAFVQSF